MRPSNRQSSTVKLYLLVYNAIQTIGWTSLLLQFCSYYIFSNEENNSLYQNIKWSLTLFQSAAVLEVIHALIGIVPSNPIFTSIQVFLRISLVCGILPNVVGAQNCLGFPIAMLAWFLTEIVRYSYYTLNLINLVPYFLTWLRYSLFIVLYPIGSLAELNCLHQAEKQYSELGWWDHKPANSVLLFCLIFPILIQLYKHMLMQREKVLGAKDGANIKSK